MPSKGKLGVMLPFCSPCDQPTLDNYPRWLNCKKMAQSDLPEINMQTYYNLVYFHCYDNSCYIHSDLAYLAILSHISINFKSK